MNTLYPTDIKHNNGEMEVADYAAKSAVLLSSISRGQNALADKNVFSWGLLFILSILFF